MAFMDAVRRPFTDLKSLVIGIVLMAIPIVNFLAIGYVLNCAGSTMKKKNEMPKWGDWWNLFVRGIITRIIGVIFAIPLILVAILALGAAFLSGLGAYAMQTGGVASLLTGFGALGIGLVVTAIVAVIISLVGSAAIMRFVDNGYKFSAAFELSAIFKKAFTGTFFAAWLVALVYAVVVMMLLSFIPLIGALIAQFIVAVTMYTILAEAYKKA